MYNVDLMKNVFFMHNRFDLYVNILLTEKWLSTQSSEVTQWLNFLKKLIWQNTGFISLSVYSILFFIQENISYL